MWRLMIIFLLLVLAISCSSTESVLSPTQSAILSGQSNTTPAEYNEPLKESDFIAVYLAVGEGQLSQDDLQSHPEVLVVNNFDDFQQAATAKIQLWIDKSAVPLIDVDWLSKEPQRYYPLVLVGYNDSLYSFRHLLRRHMMSGPIVDWSKRTLVPGFSLDIPLQDKPRDGLPDIPSFLGGYKQVPTVQAILDLIRTVEETRYLTFHICENESQH